VGNTSAHPMGGGYAEAGATLGPAMTMGYLAGKDLAEGGEVTGRADAHGAGGANRRR
jgi:hypothetical protein